MRDPRLTRPPHRQGNSDRFSWFHIFVPTQETCSAATSLRCLIHTTTLACLVIKNIHNMAKRYTNLPDLHVTTRDSYRSLHVASQFPFTGTSNPFQHDDKASAVKV